MEFILKKKKWTYKDCFPLYRWTESISLAVTRW